MEEGLKTKGKGKNQDKGEKEEKEETAARPRRPDDALRNPNLGKVSG